MAWYSKTYTLLKSVHNDLDDATVQMMQTMQMTTTECLVFPKCEQKIANTHPSKCTHPPTQPPTHAPTHPQASRLDGYNKLSLWLSLKRNEKKPVGLKLSPIKDILLDSSLSVNRKLITHILTNIPIHPATHPWTHPHIDIWVGWLQ